MNMKLALASVCLPALLALSGACRESQQITAPLATRATVATAIPWAGDPQLAQLLAAVRDSTVAYHDVDAAIAAGYRPSREGCESSTTGAMGIHYGHPALLGIVPNVKPTTGTNSVIDPLRPEVLLYEPQPDGRRRLVAVEYVVYRAAWDAAHGSPPTLLGVPFDERFGVNAHGHADHYELHVWLWRHNPLGMFAPWNPKVGC